MDAGTDVLTYGEVVQTSFCSTGSLYQPKFKLCNNAPAATPTASPTGKIYQTVITGDQLDPMQVKQGTDSSGAAMVEFGIKAEAAPTLFNFTSSHINHQMAIVLDGKVLSTAAIMGAISNKGEITNPLHWNTPQGRAEVAYIVMALQTGTLPLDLEPAPSK